MLDLHQVYYSLNSKMILDGITVQADDRRIGIVGRNGSGKTTLARLLAGLIKPTGGHLAIGGVNVCEDRKAAIRTVGILFQNPDHQIIFPTVVEELSFGLHQLGFSKTESLTKVKHMLKRFGCETWLDVSIATLSHGQRHFVCLMAVLLMEPQVIILDEPFTGLDIPTTKQLNRYFDALEVSLIHISHSPETLLGYQRVLWLDHGKITMNGKADKVLKAFGDEMERLGNSHVIT